MRIVGTQAKATKKHLDNARDIILKAIENNNLNVRVLIEQELNKIPNSALALIEQLAEYEADYSYKKMKQLPGVQPLSKLQIRNVIDTVLLNTSVQASKTTILDAYRQFAEIKAKQYLKLISDTQLDYVGLDIKIIEVTKGLFSTQNKALAKLSVVATANSIRNRIIINANSR